LSINHRLSIRKVSKQDNSALLKWAKDLETRNNSFHGSPITKHQHRKWFTATFKEQCRNPALICLKNGRARVGIIRFTRKPQKKNSWEIHFTVAPKYRGQGFAQPMLKNALGWFRQAKPNQVIYAKVKSLNFKSLKVLQSIGFIKETQIKKTSDLVRLWLPARSKKLAYSPIFKI